MFTTITATRADICRRCQGPIAPGQRIRYGGCGRAYHLAADCPTTTTNTSAATEPAASAPRGPSRTCPTCRRPNALTSDEASRGYQCRDCTRAEEGPLYQSFYAPPE